MKIESLIKKVSAKSARSKAKNSSIVISSRLRLARNLDKYSFPNCASDSQRCDILSDVEAALSDLPYMKNGDFFTMDSLRDFEKKILVERHWISKELAEQKKGSAVYISSDQICSVMINEEDHLRIQFIKNNFNLNSL